MRKVVAPLLWSWGAAEVGAQGRGHLVLVKLAAGAERSKVVGVVAHACVLPVDEVVLAAGVDEEVEVKKVVVAKAGAGVVSADVLLEPGNLGRHLIVAGDVDGAAPAQEALIAACLLEEVEAALDHGSAFVEGARHLHHARCLGGVMGIGLVAIRDKAGDLPAALGVFEHEGVVYAQVTRGLEGRELGLAVDEQLGANAGMAVHPLARVRGEVAGEVGDSLLERIEVAYLLALAAEHAHDVVKDLRVDVGDEVRVKALQLGEGVKLVNDPLGVAADLHVELADVVGVDGLPELGVGLGAVQRLAKQRHKAIRKGVVEVDVAEHDPRVVPAHGHARDAVSGAGLKAPLVGGAVYVLGRVVGAVDVALKGILGEVVVGGADVGVSKFLAGEPERPAVVLLGVLVVHDDLDAVLGGEVEEVLLLVAHDYGDVGDATFEELLDLALDEDLALHAQHTLGALVGEGHEAAGESGGHDDGVVHAVGLEGVHAALGDTAGLD